MAITNFRIMSENFIDLNVLANYSVSSENASFPVENIFNEQRRSKVWRSQGYWKIDSTNKVLKFKETSGGTTLTAILSEGEYNSFSSFSSEIKLQMEVVGGSTYTITQSTFRFNFASNGVGGTGDFELILSGSTLAAEIGMTSDKTGALTYQMDLIKLHQNEWIEFDLGIATNPDAFILVDQRNQPIQISPTATIKLQANETGNFDNPSFEQAITYDDEVLAIIDENGIAPLTEGYRYWRCYFNDSANPNGYIQMGAAFLGNYLTPTRGRATYPLNQNYIDNSTTIFSEGGQTFSDIREVSQNFSIDLKGLQKSDIEAFDNFFNTKVKTAKPFFISMDSGVVFSSAIQRRIIFCKFSSPPSWILISPDNFTMRLNFREEL